MFTGIIEEIGEILEVQNFSNISKIKIKAKKILEDIKLGHSISVNGICLTVTDFKKDYFTADIMSETKNLTTFKYLNLKTKVNLERALKLGDRLSGHIVYGHVDGLGKIIDIKKIKGKYDVKISLKQEMLKFIVKKGSIAINGASLTVSDIFYDSFIVSLIPHTIENTILSLIKTGDNVNIELDVVGKYVLNNKRII